jgi:CubicO group peptidase (beta-lactamase class C family)
VTDQPRPELVFEVAGASALARSAGTDNLRGYLEGLVSQGFPASVSLAVVEGEGVALRAYGGDACVVGEVVPTTNETSYDLASLTKVVCTVTLALIARQRGALALDDPVARWLPGYPQEQTTLWHLLTHTAGLVDHRPFHMTLQGRAQIQGAVFAEAKGTMPGQEVRYSDLSYMLLGWVMQACWGRDLDEAFAAEVAVPLAMDRTMFRPPRSDRYRVAATELDGDQRCVPGLVWGEVHDGNAFALGGVSGHAGLFAPVGDLVGFVQALLSRGTEGVLSPESLALMGSRQAGDGDDVRGIGWRLQPKDWGRWPATTIWHTGFTGTSLLIAPEKGTAVVLLTNSVHPRRRLDDQAAMRAEVHRLVAEALA